MNLKFTLLSAGLFLTAAQIFSQGTVRLGNSKVISSSKETNLPGFISVEDKKVKESDLINWAVYALNIPNNSTFKPYSVEKDELGFTHVRHQQYMAGIPVEGTMLISHSKDGYLKMLNGDYYQQFNANLTATLTEFGALQYALNKVNAKKYMWENSNMQKITGNDYLPKGELVIVHKKGADYSEANMRLSYKFNIYAEKPLYRANVFVDANSGEILDEQNLICTIDVNGTASTMYSGTVTITSDSMGVGQYRLQETGRGNGIRTYNMQNGTSYPAAVDFTNNSSTWNISGPDQAATDAHWGAEMTYEYYKLIHGRNSIDNAGYALVSYVHYDNSFANAFWDGQEMTYGDGGSFGFTIMTGLDVCGHEITHGLTSNTAKLGSGEAGALNEGFSDIFGTSIERFARPLQNDWVMGAEITTNHLGIRNMADPKSLSQPNCYLGTNWDPSLEPHQDNGPCIYWYYLLCQGGAGTNDIGSVYNVTGITMTKAEKIAFRGLTVYFTPNTTYADARKYTIQAASDLFGPCSAEIASTTDAWYAVGVGPQYSPSNVMTSYTTSPITCAMPITVAFSNATVNAASYAWSFGDGTISTLASPTHTYTTAGNDTVKLVATSCTGTKDSTTMVLTLGVVGIPGPLTEGFETNTLPGPDWNLSPTGASWAVTSTAAATGVKSAMLNNMSNSPNDTSYFESISYDISSFTTPKLSFKMAHRQKSSTNNDKLQVFTSTDCGYSWVSRWARIGSALATVTPPSATPFVPTSSQFNTYTVNINGVFGKPNVRFRFTFFAGADTTGPGNNIYIDDINLYDASIGVENFNAASDLSIYPNPASGTVNVDFVFSARHEVTVSVLDVLGRTIETLPAKNYMGETKLLLNEKTTYQPGVYLVNINVDGEMTTKKIIIE